MTEKITKFIETITNNPWFLFITGVITILAYIWGIRNKKVKRPKVLTKSINILTNNVDKIEGLKISYLDEEIPNVTITKVIIWNEGKETIDGSDIAPKDPLVIKALNDVRILNHNIIYVKNESNAIRLTKTINNKELKIDFDYLDYEEGVIIQILHTGDSTNAIDVEGSIKGFGKVKVANKRKKRKTIISRNGFKILDKASNFLTMIIFIIIDVFLVLLSVFSIDTYGLFTFETIGSMFMTIITGAVGYTFYKLIRKQVPRGFEDFE